MGFLPESANGRKLSRDVRCEDDIPYYKGVKPGTDPEKQVKKGTAGCHVLGVTVWDPNYMRHTADGITKREGYYEGEPPMVQVNGVVPVKYGATITARQKLMIDADGDAVPIVVPSDLSGIITMLLNGQILGEAVDSGIAGDIKMVDLDKKI